MRKSFFSYCLLFLFFLGNGLTSLQNSSLQVNKVARIIQGLKNEKLNPFEVHIEKMHIESEDLPVQYLCGLTFKNCVLSGFDFNGIDLSKTNFINTQFENCNLEKAMIWEGLTYSNILHFYKKAPCILIRIYFDLIKKGNEVYQDEFRYSYLFNFDSCNLLKYRFYCEKAEQFYQILKTVYCSSVLDGLKNKLNKTLLKTVRSYNKMLSINNFYMCTYKDFIYCLTYNQNTVIDKYIDNSHMK